MEAFVRVAETKSFIQAAEQLGVTRSVITHRVQKLEQFIQAPLFHRNTRSVQLSDLGRCYYQECADLLSKFELLTDEMAHSTKKLQGRLRIHMAPGFAIEHFGQLLAKFMTTYDRLCIELVVDDRRVDPVKDGFDMAFQMFPPLTESLVERKIFQVNRILCCSPDFLSENHFSIQTPLDLKPHQIGCYLGSHTSRNKIHYFDQGKFHELAIQSNLLSSSVHVLRDFALNHGGIVCLPTLVAHQYLIQQQLINVLPAYPLMNYDFRAIFPENSRNLSKIRTLLDFIVAHTQYLPLWDQQLIRNGQLSALVKRFNQVGYLTQEEA